LHARLVTYAAYYANMAGWAVIITAASLLLLFP